MLCVHVFACLLRFLCPLLNIILYHFRDIVNFYFACRPFYTSNDDDFIEVAS